MTSPPAPRGVVPRERLHAAAKDEWSTAVVRPSPGHELIRPDAAVERAAAGGDGGADQAAHGYVAAGIGVGAQWQQGSRLPFEGSLPQWRHGTRDA